MTESLAERQAAILRAAVREYIRTGEPVGSKHLLERARLEVSSATVRNEMARLEELGYLVQPHTSAGRIPTDAGYRFVVDELKPKPLGEGQRRALVTELAMDEDAPSIDEMLRRASDVVGRFTQHAAAVLARRTRSARIRRVEVFGLSGSLATVVVIADNGRVEQRVVQLDRATTPADLDGLAETLARDLHGVSLDEALRAVAAMARAGGDRQRSLYAGVVAAVDALRGVDDHMFVGGVSNLAGGEDFERESLHRLYQALEQQAAVLEVMTAALDRPLTVQIGHEVASEDLQNCSVVVANFGANGPASGQVGVIGPTRMDYERVIATANTVAHLLEQRLNGGS